MERLPCLTTTLDQLDLPILRIRLDALWERVSTALAQRVGLTPEITGETMTDAIGSITVMGRGQDVEILANRNADGSGSMRLSMPMPIHMSSGRDVMAGLAKVHMGDLKDLLRVWRECAWSAPAFEDHGIELGDSGYRRLQRCIAAVIMGSNPRPLRGAKITMVPATAYEPKPSMMGTPPEPSITANGKPILAREIEAAILDLHPAMRITTTGNREYRMARAGAIVGPLPVVDPLTAIRLVDALGAARHRRPVLKAGMELG